MPYNIVLVGTKLDLVDKSPKNRKVPYAVAYELAQKLNLSAFYEVSSKTSKKFDINDCFATCVIQCIEEVNANHFLALNGLHPVLSDNNELHGNGSIYSPS